MKSKNAKLLAMYIREGRTMSHFKVKIRTLMSSGKTSISYKHGYAKTPEAFVKRIAKECTERRFISVSDPELIAP